MSQERADHIRLALPLVAQQIGFQLMGIVDAALLGRFDDTGLAAAGIGNNLLFAITSIGMGVVLGIDAIVPQAIGGGRHGDARRTLSAGLRLAILTGLACSLALLATPLVFWVADVPADVAADAQLYVHMRAFGIVPHLLAIALRSYLAAYHVTRPLVLAVVLGNLANAALDVALIYGLGPIPPMGVAGAAFATDAVQLAIVALYFAYVQRLDAARAFERRAPSSGAKPFAPSSGAKPFAPSSDAKPFAPQRLASGSPSGRADITAILRYGLPISGHLFAEIGIFGVATMIAAHLGKVPAAAHSIALQLASFTFSIAVGIGGATSVRVGHAIGAGDAALARARGWLGLRIGFAVMGCGAAVFVLLPAPLASLFTDQPEIIAATVPLLQIAALFQLSDGTQAIASGALRGIGDTRAAFIGNVLGHYGVGLAISLVLTFSVGLGAPGLWWGLSAGLTATAAYLVARFALRTR